MGRMSDLNDLPRSHDVTDLTTCAWPAQEIAAAEAPVTAGTDRYMRAAAHAVARAALRELRQGTGNAGAAVAPARPVPAPLTSMSPMGPAATPASPLSPATPLGGAGETAGTQTGPGWISGAPVLLLVGGGHNGADTLLAGGLLAHSGCAVSAVLATEHPHPVALEEARGHGVTIHGAGYRSDDGTGQDSAEAMAAIEAFLVHGGLVLDGLIGIGATGALRPDAAALIAPLIAAGQPGRRPLRVIAVDLPSGTGVDDGTVSGPVLAADRTVTFTCLKGCQCLPPARHLCGVVEVVPLGLPAPTSRPLARRPVDGALGDYLTRAVGEPGPDDHKYTRGVVGLWAGSESYPGAAVLTASGAVRAGAGMVRLAAPRRVEDLVLAARPEVVPAAGRVQALVLGPGIDPTDTARADEVRAVLASTLGPCGKDRQCPTRVPTVVDAGALSILPELLTEDLSCTPLHVLTPHAGEAAALLIALEDTGTPAQETHRWSRERVETHPGLAARELCRLTGARGPRDLPPERRHRPAQRGHHPHRRTAAPPGQRGRRTRLDGDRRKRGRARRDPRSGPGRRDRPLGDGRAGRLRGGPGPGRAGRLGGRRSQAARARGGLCRSKPAGRRGSGDRRAPDRRPGHRRCAWPGPPRAQLAPGGAPRLRRVSHAVSVRTPDRRRAPGNSGATGPSATIAP